MKVRFFCLCILLLSAFSLTVIQSQAQENDTCSGDLNNDRQINLLDYSQFVQHYQNPVDLTIDFNQDQKVNLLDYSFFIQHYLVGCPEPSPVPTLTPISTIWDNGLTRQCVITAQTPTVQAGTQPPYTDLSQCLTTDPVFSNSRWQLGFQAESGYGATGNCQGFPAINSQNSPLTFNWLYQNGALTGHLALDLITKPHPCEGNHFNWYMFFNQATTTATLPRVDRLKTTHKVLYKTTKINGASRLIVSMGGFVKTSDETAPEMFSIEVALNLDGWGDNFPNDPLISKCNPATCGSHHIFIDGSQFNLHVNSNEQQTITIPWSTIYSYLVTTNQLPAPKAYTNTYLSTGNVGIGFEVNNFTQTNSYFAELFQSEFTIVEE